MIGAKTVSWDATCWEQLLCCMCGMGKLWPRANHKPIQTPAAGYNSHLHHFLPSYHLHIQFRVTVACSSCPFSQMFLWRDPESFPLPSSQISLAEVIRAAAVQQRTMQSVRIGFICNQGGEGSGEGSIEQLKPQNWGNWHVSVGQRLLHDQQSKGNQLWMLCCCCFHSSLFDSAAFHHHYSRTVTLLWYFTLIFW